MQIENLLYSLKVFNIAMRKHATLYSRKGTIPVEYKNSNYIFLPRYMIITISQILWKKVLTKPRAKFICDFIKEKTVINQVIQNTYKNIFGIFFFLSLSF